MRLVTYLDSEADTPIPIGARTIPVLETDMETTRAHAQKLIDHMLADLKVAAAPTPAAAVEDAPAPEQVAPVTEATAPAPVVEKPGQRTRSTEAEEDATAGRKGGESAVSRKRVPRPKAKAKRSRK